MYISLCSWDLASYPGHSQLFNVARSVLINREVPLYIHTYTSYSVIYRYSTMLYAQHVESRMLLVIKLYIVCRKLKLNTTRDKDTYMIYS